MSIDPDSIHGKILLLVFDKIVIGAIIAAAFTIYNVWQREDQRSYEKQLRQDQQVHEMTATEIQLKFERAKLLNQFLPIITDATRNVEYRAYVLRSALLTKSLDAEAGIDFGRQLLAEGLKHDHFIAVMLAAMPEGLPILARRIDGQKDWREERAWADLIWEAKPAVEAQRALETTEDLSLGVVGGPGTNHLGMRPRVHDLARSSSRGLRVIGNLSRVLFLPDDSEAAKQLGRELLYDNTSLIGIAYTRELMRVLRQYGPPSGSVAIPIARLLTLPNLDECHPFSEAREQYYEMRAQAGVLLESMQEPAERSMRPNTGAREAAPVLLAFIKGFRSSLERAGSSKSLDVVASKYDPGPLVQAARILGRFKSDDATRELDLLRSVNLDKLQHLRGWNGWTSRLS